MNWRNHPDMARVYDFLKQYMDKTGFAPTQREISETCKMSRASVLLQLSKLEAWGYIEREPGVARGIRLLKQDKD